MESAWPLYESKVINETSGTSVARIGNGIFRISTPVELPTGATPTPFTFNQFLIVDDEPLLYHTGGRKIFPVVKEAISSVIPIESLRYISFSHFEADECGALNDFLAVAPKAVPLTHPVSALVSIADVADRPPEVLPEGVSKSLGHHSIKLIPTPHLPHGWDAAHLYESTTGTLFCSDLYSQVGGKDLPVIYQKKDALVATLPPPGQGFPDYAVSTPRTQGMLAEKLAVLQPSTLAIMHGASYVGEGDEALKEWGAWLAKAMS